MTGNPPRLLDLVRQAIRRKHYSIRTEEAYVNWIKRFILFHPTRHPAQMGVAEIEAFLTDQAVNAKVAASTQNQALSAILFLYKEVLNQELEGNIQAVRAKNPRLILAVVLKGDIMSTRVACKKRSAQPPGGFNGADWLTPGVELPRRSRRG
jgi:site-specific recombinase XerD